MFTLNLGIKREHTFRACGQTATRVLVLAGMLAGAGLAHAQNDVLRYNGATGAFIDVFVSSGSGGLNQPEGLTFGLDGNLYVGSQATDEGLRFNGATGAFIDAFVSTGSGGLFEPEGLVFGPDGNLYVVADPQAIPEPSTFALTALGLFSLGMIGWRRRSR